MTIHEACCEWKTLLGENNVLNNEQAQRNYGEDTSGLTDVSRPP
jgi:hypothetical protein